MDHFAGLDVSVKDTSICIVDGTGRIVREVKVASEPEALLAVLGNPAYHFKRIGLEAGPLSQWLFSALAEAGLPVICVETRHMRAVLKAQINKTDRNDARGMAQMMRAGIEQEIPLSVDEWRRERILYRWAQNLFDPSLIRIPEPIAPRPSFGLPELTVAVRTSLPSCRAAGKTRTFTPVRE